MKNYLLLFFFIIISCNKSENYSLEIDERAELRDNLGKAGRATVDAYRWEAVAERIFGYYVECAEQVHSTRGVPINDDSHMATSSNPSIR